MLFMASEGVTIGAHRMYSHKALKGHFITRLGLIVLQTMAGQVRKKSLATMILEMIKIVKNILTNLLFFVSELYVYLGS